MDHTIPGTPARTSKQGRAWTTAMHQACERIAPLWPLDRFVAVNPYHGLADLSFEEAAGRLAQAGSIRMTLPISFYLQALQEGSMTEEDLAYALDRSPLAGMSVEGFLGQLEEDGADQEAVQLVADAAAEATAYAWSDFMVDRVTSWASAYFDQGQSLWQSSPGDQDLFAAWRTDALTDRSPAIMGLKHFRRALRALPADAEEAAVACLAALEVPGEALPLYLHGLLLRLGGWAAYAAQLDWENRLYGGPTDHVYQFLTVLLCWETCLLRALPADPQERHWAAARRRMRSMAQSDPVSLALRKKLVLQQAYDRACQRSLLQKLHGAAGQAAPRPARPPVQAIFCIDVRSEIIRRQLEQVDPKIETLGFAGFFAFPVRYIPIGRRESRTQCPVLIPAGPTVRESMGEPEEQSRAVRSRSIAHQVQEAWKAFKLGAISCFSFVGPIGLAYLPKLYSDAFGRTRPVAHPDQAGLPRRLRSDARRVSLEQGTCEGMETGIALEQQVELAQSALQAMSLTDGFARLVLLVGHGSTTVNNPHATGLDCGACGGQSGEANAKIAAAVLNNPGVRVRLADAGIRIPADTHFLAGLHDTATDEVRIFHEGQVPSSHRAELAELKKSLAKAGQAARMERAARLGIEKGANLDAAVLARSRDWSQVRPEWGLAGCHAFVVAPRRRTQGLDLGGRSFLHSYAWEQDEGFAVLELIMTAPMVVTSWINLQYYASTVDNRHFGSGNKTLHNITGGLGVLEGNTGNLRTGLPWQSVHDGEEYQHLPQRLNVIIEAPIEAMNGILAKHELVRQLCDHGWIQLLAMDEQGRVAHRYSGDLSWEALQAVAVS